MTETERSTAIEGEDQVRILARWLIGLRWVVFLLLGVTLPLDDLLFGFHVRYAIAVPVVCAVLALNAVMHRRISRGGSVSTRGAAIGVAIDLAAAGAVLAASGGAANPFSAIFFVHVALAASLLPARTTFALAALSVAVFGSLFALPSGACCPNHPANGAFSNHLYGMLLAFVIAAALVAFFLTRVRRALDERGREIAILRRQAEENARFASLGTLAAGTAHELATPLGTIAVLAGELASGATPGDAETHGASIAGQIKRCRDILTKMQAGAAASKPGGDVPIAEAVRRAVDTWRRAHPEAAVTLASRLDAGPATRVELSEGDVEAALCALLDNALHATRSARTDEAITVEIARDGGAVIVRVEDSGTGVAPHLAGRLGEPFLTTKEPGEGMGLGLYLIRTLVAQVGGRLEVAERAPRGTRITLRLLACRA